MCKLHRLYTNVYMAHCCKLFYSCRNAERRRAIPRSFDTDPALILVGGTFLYDGEKSCYVGLATLRQKRRKCQGCDRLTAADKRNVACPANFYSCQPIEHHPARMPGLIPRMFKPSLENSLTGNAKISPILRIAMPLLLSLLLRVVTHQTCP